MKIPLLYGALMALAGALVTYGLFFAGYQDTPEKMQASQWVAPTVGLIVAILFLALAMRDRRAQQPIEQPWTYGSAVGAGVMTGLWAALIGAVFTYVYLAIINPQFRDVLAQVQTAKFEAKGLSESQIETAQRFSSRFTTPVVMTILGAIGSFCGSVVISLIVAIFFRRREVAAPPLETAAPPPVA